MNKWISEGNCLLKRTEKRYDISNKKIDNIISKILDTGLFTEETFFKTYKSTIIWNLIFDIPEADNVKVFARKSYTGARLRVYFSSDGKNTSYAWGEWKTKDINKTVKTRTCIKSEKALYKFVSSVLNKNLVPVMDVIYERRALNSKDKKIRITFDKNIHYYNMSGKEVTDRSRTKITTTKIKIKYIGKEPIKIFKIIERGM
jgi:hypothetical protein